MKEIFRSSKFDGKLILKPSAKVNEAGDEVYGSLENGLWWRSMQNQLPEDATIAPVLLYSDETLAYGFGSTTFYPLYMSIGNLPKDIRRKEEGYTLIAYLPILKGKKKQKRRWAKKNLKGQILHHALSIILRSLIEPAKT